MKNAILIFISLSCMTTAAAHANDSACTDKLSLLNSLCADVGPIGTNQEPMGYHCYTAGINSIIAGESVERFIYNTCKAGYGQWYSTSGPRMCFVKGIRYLSTPAGEAIIAACEGSFVNDPRQDDVGYKCVLNGFEQAYLK